ncbi:unnamed protein product [Choristocarpus tenellus]
MVMASYVAEERCGMSSDSTCGTDYSSDEDISGCSRCRMKPCDNEADVRGNTPDRFIDKGTEAGVSLGVVESDLSTLCEDWGIVWLRAHIERHSIKFVVFDMDLTVTSKHSGGQLPQEPEFVASYLDSARDTDAFKAMRLCHFLGVKIGVATFQREVDDGRYIGGSRLVRDVLNGMGVGGLVGERDIVALNARQYVDMIRFRSTYNKNDMIRTLFDCWGVDFAPGSTLLIDDTLQNLEAFVRIGGHGLHILGGQGMMLERTRALTPVCVFVPGEERRC